MWGNEVNQEDGFGIMKFKPEIQGDFYYKGVAKIDCDSISFPRFYHFEKKIKVVAKN